MTHFYPRLFIGNALRLGAYGDNEPGTERQSRRHRRRRAAATAGGGGEGGKECYCNDPGEEGGNYELAGGGARSPMRFMLTSPKYTGSSPFLSATSFAVCMMKQHWHQYREQQS